MFKKTKYLSLLVFILTTANASRAMATPPELEYGKTEVKTELTFTETPELDKLTTVHLKATALNDYWPRGKIKVIMSGGKVVVFPKGEDWPVWENIKTGDVFEADFKIKPYGVGGLGLYINFGMTHDIYYIRLDENGKFIKMKSEADVWKSIGVDYKSDKWPKFNKTQSDSVQAYINNEKPYIKTTITKDYIEYREGNVIINISPLPALDSVSKVVVMKIECFEDRKHIPQLGISKMSKIIYWGQNQQVKNIWPVKGLENQINYIDDFIGPNKGIFISEFAIKPQYKYATIDINIAVNNIADMLSSRQTSIGFIFDNIGKLYQFNGKQIPLFKVEK
jgi:hypothetical protein